MRKVLISLGVATAALAVAAPASAQYYPGQQYGAPYGNAYGYNNNGWGQARALQVRVDQIQRNLRRLVQVRAISSKEFRNRNDDARDIEQRLRRDSRDGYGLNGQELAQLQYRVARLEQKIARDTRDGRGWNNGYSNYGYNAYDRDRDGRDDRYEDDHGNRRD